MPPRMNPALRARLIEHVQRKAILYDTRHEGHRDNEQREAAWAEIAESLAENSEVLKREWKILRDSLRQAMKQGYKKNGEPCKRWPFETKMAFLKPYMTKRPTYHYGEDNGTELLKPESADTSSMDVSDPDPVPDVEERRYHEEPGCDTLDLFFASASLATRRLPKPLQRQVKRQVLDALLAAEAAAEHTLTRDT